MINKLLKCPHLLIAGATGSGKSTLEALLLAKLVGRDTPPNELWLIDPKKVELFPWRASGTCRAYADDPNSIVNLLRDLNNVMDTRYTAMRSKRLTMTTDRHIYCVIDEYSDIIYSGIRRLAEPVLCRLLALGRAAGIHLIICTQRPTADIITGMIKANISDRIALHTVNAQDSRNIIGVSGAELLPRYGQAIISLADGTLERVAVQPLTDIQLKNIFNQLGGLKKMKKYDNYSVTIINERYGTEEYINEGYVTFASAVDSCHMEWAEIEDHTDLAAWISGWNDGDDISESLPFDLQIYSEDGLIPPYTLSYTDWTSVDHKVSEAGSVDELLPRFDELKNNTSVRSIVISHKEQHICNGVKSDYVTDVYFSH